MFKFFEFLSKNPDVILSLSGASILLLMALSAIIFLVVKTHLTKSIETDFNKRLEDHKALNNLKLERFKLDKARENIKFSIFNEKRALVIAEMYSLLKTAKKLVSDIIISKIDDSETTNALKAIQNFHMHFSKNLIFLPEKMEKDLYQIHNELAIIVLEFDNISIERKIEIEKHFFKNIAGALKELEQEFRLMLGYKKTEDNG